MTVFFVHLNDGDVFTFDDNAEGFLLRWKDALVNNQREWPYAYLKPKQLLVDGSPYPISGRAVHFNPMTITAVEVEMSEDG